MDRNGNEADDGFDELMGGAAGETGLDGDGDAYGTSAANHDSDDSDMPNAPADPEKHRGRRSTAVLIAFIAAFAAIAIAAGVVVVRTVNARHAEEHASALSACASARKGFSITYTSYAPTMASAAKLSRTPDDEASSPYLVKQLADVIAPMKDGVSPLNMSELSKTACSPNMSTADLRALADNFSSGESDMVNRMISVQYQAEAVKSTIAGKQRESVGAQLDALVVKARLAFTRSAGKVDDAQRGALQTAADQAEAAHKDTGSANALLQDRLASLRSAYDAVVAGLTGDCHFHPCVALTFDDGPNKQLTPKLLDVLQRNAAPATFFLQGQFVNGSSVGIVAREAAQGHAVGSISWRHTQLHAMSADQLKKWFDDTDQVISSASGQPVTLFRPPDGAWSDAVRSQAAASGQSMILWSVDSQDWRDIDSKKIADNVVNGASDGSIISLHDGRQATIDAMPAIIDGLRAKGLRIVTVPQLLDGDLKPGGVFYSLGDTTDD